MAAIIKPERDPQPTPVPRDAAADARSLGPGGGAGHQTRTLFDPVSKPHRPPTRLWAVGLLLAAGFATLGQQQPFSAGGTAQPAAPPAGDHVATTNTVASGAGPANPVARLLGHRLPEALANGKLSVNARLRMEYADISGAPAITEPSYAPTLRTRFGFTSAPVYGFQGMLEGANMTVLGPEANYNAAGSNGRGYKPVVGDPPATYLNQAWLGYTYTNWVTVKAGRQRLVLDNQRFIGDVDWRQNMQTFDAAGGTFEPLAHLDLTYDYLWYVHRVFADVAGLPPANRDFASRSHLINLDYSAWKYGRFVAYSYLLDLRNAAGSANSCATYGGYFAGASPVVGQLALDYRAEFAEQSAYGDNPAHYWAPYYNVELGATLQAVSVGSGYEVLGSDNAQPFRTPLATLHAFNGWAEAFLTPPASGLRDLYGYTQVILPGDLPLRFVYHKFDAASGGADFGQEFDLQLSRQFGKSWTALLEYAYYNGQNPAPPSFATGIDVQRLWLQVEFRF